MKTRQLLSTSILFIISASIPLSANAAAAAPKDTTSLVSRDVAEHRLDKKGDRIEERLDRKGDHRQAWRNSRVEAGRHTGRQYQSGHRVRNGANRKVSGKRRR